MIKGFSPAEEEFLHNVINKRLFYVKKTVGSGSTVQELRCRYKRSYLSRLRNRTLSKANAMLAQLLVFQEALVHDEILCRNPQFEEYLDKRLRFYNLQDSYWANLRAKRLSKSMSKFCKVH